MRRYRGVLQFGLTLQFLALLGVCGPQNAPAAASLPQQAELRKPELGSLRSPQHKLLVPIVSRAAVLPTQSPTLTATAFPTITPECVSDSSQLSLLVSSQTLHVRDTLEVTLTLQNIGCVALGLPMYRLYQEPSGYGSIFRNLDPTEVVHYLAIAPGSQDSAALSLEATQPGSCVVRGYVSYEVHLGYPGPAYWSGCSSALLTLEVLP